jgi:aldehyde:ferredoxin oxidoreductase
MEGKHLMYNGGYMGKILRIDLTNQSTKEDTVSEELASKYLGGVGFAFKYLYDELKPGTPPLDKENKLIFAVGPLTATGVSCTSRMAVAAKSPLTNTIACALSGGYFPAEMKRAGYDMIIVEGKAEKPTYVAIKGGKVSFRSAAKLSGMKTSDTQMFIKDELRDQNYRVVCIGPAGEKLIPMAAIINERRAAGRKGLGAVMGSKNLKAIAVLGTSRPSVVDQVKFREARRVMNQGMKDSPTLYPGHANTGTPSLVDLTTAMGIFSIKNWSATGEVNMVPEIGLDAQQAIRVIKAACADCPVACSQVKLISSGPYAGFLTEGPEFETTYSLGSAVGVTYLPAIIAGDRLCDEYGIDTISAGVTIGFAMELYERAILTKQDTGGLELKFGNYEAMIEMLRQITYKEGLGAILCEGSKKAAEKIGKGSAKYAMHIKGLELPVYDVRGAKAHGLNYATAYNGADHNRGYAFQEIFGIPIPEKVDRFAIKGKGKLTKWNQDVRCATTDCPTLCAFILDMGITPIACQIIADLTTAATGIPFTAEQIQQVGERVNNIARLFNGREGFSRKDDTFPERLMTEPIKAGASAGQLISQADLDTMLNEYYEARGWDNSGTPTPAKLSELGLE